MKRTFTSLLSLALLSAAAFAADAPSLGQTLDGQFRNAEREIVGLVEAMPADRINFTPQSLEIKGSDFKGVRTFAQEAKHLGKRADTFEVAAFDLETLGSEVDPVGRHGLHQPDDFPLRVAELAVERLAE